MHKSEVFFYLLASFILGVFMASLFNFSSWIVLVLVIVGMSVIILSGFTPLLKSEIKFAEGHRFSRAGLKSRLIILAGFLILAFAGGTARFNDFNESGDYLMNLVGQDVVLSGYINSEPEISGTKMRFDFRAEGDDVLVTTNPFPERKFGDSLNIKGKLKLPENFTHSTDSGQADFDYVMYLKKAGIRTVMSSPGISQDSGNVSLGTAEKVKLNIYRQIFYLKNKFQDAINLSMPEPNAAYVNGILLGSRQNIPPELKDAFSRTSTTHILAISGYNITIMADVVLMALVFFIRRKNAFWISTALVILFTILTGASSSVVRAAIMGLLLLFASGYGRLYDVKNSIILAGAVMVYANPFVLAFDVGFQLSFMAVIGLVYVYPVLDNRLRKVPKLGIVKETVLMSLSAQAAVLPLLIYYFKNLSLVSLFANVLVLPFLPYAMLAGFLAGVGGMIFTPLGQLLGFIAWAVTSYQIKVVEFLGNLSFASLAMSFNWQTMLGVYLFLVIIFFKLKGGKHIGA